MERAFDHLTPGTPEWAWSASVRLANMPAIQLPAAVTRLVVLSAHPDDETLGAGGLIANAARNAIPVVVLVATDGEGSHPRSRTHTVEDLRVLRRAEARKAMAVLAPQAELSFLGLPDGGLRNHGAELAAAIDGCVEPGALLVTPWREDRHPDHEACAFAARIVARRRGDFVHWQVPIWAWHWADPDGADLPWQSLARFELEPADAATKHQALLCYPSQHLPLSDQVGDEAILPEAVLAHFVRPFETVVTESAHAAGDASYFDSLYEQSADPWELADRFYERRKRDLLMASLPRERFASAFEPGCATGLLTERLSARCDSVLAWDSAENAIGIAGANVGRLVNVQVDRGVIPGQWPQGQFELVVISEVGYYCDDLALLTERIMASLTPDGVLVACHWRHPAADHPYSAQAVHDAIGSALHPLISHVEEDFLLDVWSRLATSVARATAILG
jgi:LmbE family N-acetylglucosaminyl deacetylase